MLKEKSELCKELLETNRNFLYRQAMSMTQRPEDAEDLLHDTVVLIYKGFHTFRNHSNFRAWAKRIMLNHQINQQRCKSSQMVFVDNISGGEFDPMYFNSLNFIPNSDSPENCFFRNHINPDLMKALYGLEQDHRIIFSLYHFEGYNYDEISEALSLPLGTVKSRIYRSKQYMMELLKKIQSESEYDLCEGRLR